WHWSVGNKDDEKHKLNAEGVTKFLQGFIFELFAVISDEVMWDTKAIDDVMIDELTYFLRFFENE
ncbi:hypothetical protein KI387_007987, partial [Taxus chinensis]